MLISLKTLLTNLSSIFHSRAALQLENLALRLSFAKTPAGFKIREIARRRVTCYLDEFRRRTQLLRSTTDTRTMVLGLSVGILVKSAGIFVAFTNLLSMDADHGLMFHEAAAK